MLKITLGIDGMQCSMCESHVNDAIRRAFHVKKVESSHGKNQTMILTEEPLDRCVRLGNIFAGKSTTAVGCFGAAVTPALIRKYL